MEIEIFIKARLAKLESAVATGMVSISGVNITKEVQEDIKATRDLLEVIRRLEQFAYRCEDPFEALRYVSGMRRIIADRWSGHKDYKEYWPLG